MSWCLNQSKWKTTMLECKLYLPKYDKLKIVIFCHSETILTSTLSSLKLSLNENWYGKSFEFIFMKNFHWNCFSFNCLRHFETVEDIVKSFFWAIYFTNDWLLRLVECGGTQFDNENLSLFLEKMAPKGHHFWWEWSDLSDF